MSTSEKKRDDAIPPETVATETTTAAKAKATEEPGPDKERGTTVTSVRSGGSGENKERAGRQ